MRFFFILLTILTACTTSSDLYNQENQPKKSARSTPRPSPTVNQAESGPAKNLNAPRVPYRSVYDAPEVGKAFQDARKAYDAGQKREALLQMQSYVNATPGGQFADEAHFLLGKQAFDNNDFETANSEFQKVIELNPPSKLRGEAIYSQALALNNLGKRKEALIALSQIDVREIAPAQKSKVFMSWGKMAGEEGRWLESTLAYIKARKDLAASPQKSELESLIEEQVESRLAETELQFLSQEYPNDYPMQFVQIRMANLKLANGDRDAAKALLQNVVASSPPQSRSYVKANTMLARLSTLTEGVTRKVGVLLPLTGRQESIGKAMAEGMQLATAGTEPKPFEWIFADVGPSNETALKAFERLVFEDKAMAIAGPLNGNQADVLASKANELGIPYLALSPRAGLREKGPYIFRMALSPEQQVRALVGYATERLNAKRFAIIFPEDNFGKEYAQEYFNSVREFGGEVTAAESYNPNQSDFRIQIENMIGTGFPSFRKTESADLLKKLEEKLSRQASHKEQEQARAPAIVDFDVLFIPDTFKAVGQIVPALVYADVTTPQLMGPATWNNPKLLERAGQYMDKAIFVDAFAPERQSKVTQDFVTKYQGKRGVTPSSLSATGYDMGLALKTAFSSGVGENRDEFRSRLETMGSMEGSLGLHVFDSRRDSLSELQLYQIGKGQFHYQGGVAIRPRSK